MAAWFEKVETVLSELDVHSEQGLSTDEANKRQALHGKNEVEDGPEASLFRLVLKQFEDLMVIILLVAAFVSFLLALLEESKNDRLTAFVEPVVILVILFMNALFGVIQERDAERAIQSLKSFEATTATVLRDNKLQIINGIDLVPGDILQLVAGDKVPADARILEVSTSCFATDQAILTGEVESCFKHAEALARGEAVVNQDKTNMVFSGTLVIKGKCRAVVTAIGTATEMGMIQSELGQISTGQSPLKEKLDEFGERLSKLIAIVCISVWLINIQHFGDPVHGGILRGAVYYFKIAVALAVAAVPEGLPAVVTSCLALGTRIMTKNGAIVRSLPSVETLGCTTVICVDKTGTITSNEMVAQRIITFDENDQAVLHSVTGAGYEPHGFVTSSGYLSTYSIPLEEVSKIITLCNDAEIRLGPEQHTYSRIGEPTECALRVLAAKLNNLRLGQNSHPENEIFDYWKALLHRVSTNEFTRERMLMSVVSFDPQMSQYSVFAKGAPESILRRCTRYVSGNGEIRKLTETVHTVLMEQLRNLSKEAFRVIAVAKREVDEMEIVRTDPESLVQLEQDLSFVGFVGICDPPRASVSNAIEKCYQAGMRIIVLTGDSSDTAQAVCRSVGILDSDENTPEVGTVVTGSDWMGMTEKEQRDCATSVKVLARIEPMHKLKLVQYLQDAGEVVAMTGDGVNDAPALKQADIGISMGSGTSVAKEASDIVLIHNDFSTIITAVEQGRTIFANTKQFIRYLVSSNIGEVACIFLAAALGIPEGLIPVQLLWVNLVTDGLPAIALGFNKPDATVMQRKPRSKSDGIVNNWLTVRFLVIGLYVGVAVVVGFVWWFMFYESGPKLNWHELQSFESCDPHTSKAYSCDIFKWTSDGKMRYPSTVALSILVVIEMLNALNSLSEDESLLTVTPASNPWLIASIITSLVLHGLILYIPFFANIFNVAPLSLVEWTAVIWFSAPVIIVDETMKYLSRNTVSHINNGKLIQNSWLRIDRSDKLV